MLIKYELDEKDIIRILAEHFNVPEGEVELGSRQIETGWEMSPIIKHIPYAIIKTKQK